MLGLLPTWVTFLIGALLIIVGIAVGEPVPIILGPLFLLLAGARYAFTSSTESSAKRMEAKAPLGPPVKQNPAGVDELPPTLRLTEGRVAIVAFGALMVFIGLGAWATYGADPASLLGLPFIVLGGAMATAWRKRIEVSPEEVRFVGFRPWTIRLRWTETRAIGRGLAREGSLLRDPRFSAFAIVTSGEKRPLPVTDADPGAFEWLVAHARGRGVEVPPEEQPPGRC